MNDFNDLKILRWYREQSSAKWRGFGFCESTPSLIFVDMSFELSALVPLTKLIQNPPAWEWLEQTRSLVCTGEELRRACPRCSVHTSLAVVRTERSYTTCTGRAIDSEERKKTSRSWWSSGTCSPGGRSPAASNRGKSRTTVGTKTAAR